MYFSVRLIVGIWLCAAALAAPDQYAVDWNRINAETLDHFSALLRIDTSNPPGNETKAAKYVLGVLEREGIQARLFAKDPDRANVVARIRGNGSRKPVLIMGHTDVVGVQREKWTVDPFAAIRKDGYIYGRGAVDDKDNLAACLMLMLMLKRMNVALDRDVIFLAEAGEESTTSVGIDFMVREHWTEIEAEFALAEGGGGLARDGKIRFVSIATTEKVPRGVRLVARGTAGHGSVPRPDNPVVRLSSAVAKIAAWLPPMRLNDTTRAYFERLATISTPEEASRYNGIVDPSKAPGIERYFAEQEIQHSSVLRTSISPTILKAGFRQNVIPSEAEATLDIRALPDEDIDGFYARMRDVIGDASVEIVPRATRGRPAGQPSRLDTPMFRALEVAQRATYPGGITLPTMLTGATDMAQLRARGVQAYGIGPVIDERDRLRGSAHGDDEKIQESALYRLVEFQWRAVLEIAGAK
jgi:acetylornithine deacetylase/succinyl-diaminopimelate desuccinylase-like protein